MNLVLWSTVGTKGKIEFSPHIQWNECIISQNQIISVHYFDQPIYRTGNGNYEVLSRTVKLLKSRQEGKYMLMTYLTENNLIQQIFCELKGSKPLIDLSVRTKRNPVLFILNPFGGTKAASKLFNRLIKPLIILCSLPFELMETTHAKHAIAIAHNLDFDKYSAIVSVSGDGVFHEIINGLFTRKDWKNVKNIPLGIIGAGTGNAISQNLDLSSPERAFLAVLNAKTTPLDIFSYYQPGDHGVQFSHLSVAWGLIADLDIESEAYRWLGGERFTVAALIRLINFRTYTGSLYILPFESSYNEKKIEDIDSIPKDYKSWPVRVEGDFRMFLASNYPWLSKEFKVSNSETLNSGSMQLVWSTNLSTFQGLSVLLHPSDGEWINRPEITSIKAKSFVLEPGPFSSSCSRPSTRGILNVSGELVPYERIMSDESLRQRLVLMNLPPELWLKISQYFTRQDLSSLFRVNKRFQRLLRSMWYRDITVKVNSFQKFCVLIASSALKEDGSNQEIQNVLMDISKHNDEPEVPHHDLSTLDEFLFLIQNPQNDLNLFLEQIMGPLTDNVVDHSYRFEPNTIFNRGYGKYLKRLAIPSDGFSLSLLKVFLFLPNLKKITFYHPPHDEKWIPFLKPKVLEAIASNFQSLQSIVIEDLSRIVWKPFINILSQFGSCLLHLTIEASGELEPFFTQKGVFKVLSQNLPNLKALRLDGIPAGDYDSIAELVCKCQKLENIVLDYCFGITMDSLCCIWNGLTDLKFLGFSGLNGILTANLVKRQDKLKTLRFVDCAVTDELFQSLAPLCSNLEMIRVVFEDPLEITDYSIPLSDRTIEAFYPCKKLKIMAITRCKFMNGDSFSLALKQGHLTTLDLHKDPDNSIGEVNETFAQTVLSYLCNSDNAVSVLNLFGQNSLSSGFLYSCLTRGFFFRIKSLSLNYTQIDHNFMLNVLEYCPKLEYLSIKNCNLITAACVKTFVESIHPESKFKKLYALENSKDIQSNLLEPSDSWFGDQRLDITSLWEDAIYPL